MYFHQYLKRLYVSIKKIILELTVYKLLCIALAIYFTIIFSILIELMNKEPEDFPQVDFGGIDNGGVIEVDNRDKVVERSGFNSLPRNFIDQTNNPPIIWWNQGLHLNGKIIECPNKIRCNKFGMNYKLRPNSNGAYIFYASTLNFSDLPLPRQPKQVIWALSHEESPRNVAELLHEPGLNLFNFSSTFSRYSDVPFPLQNMESLKSITSRKHFVSTEKKKKFLNEISPVIFISSNTYTFTDRDKYVKELMKYIPVDSYGTCLNNKQLPDDFPKDYLNNLDDTAFLNFIARYKFAIAIENGICEDYVTEKFWRPIKVGVVPIYFGSPSIADWYPNNKSAILINDFPSPKHLSDYLYELLQNDTLYEEYLEHKTKGYITNTRLVEEIKARPYQTDTTARSNMFECFICKKLHEKIKEPKVNVVTKRHYNCSRPISALTLKPSELAFLEFWKQSAEDAELLYERVRSGS